MNSGHVAVRAGAKERCLMNQSQNARSWSACSWLLYCSMQRVMFRPCTHMSDHVHMVQSESDMIEYVSLCDWPYVMSRQNNQTERDQLMVNSLLYEWCTFPWLYKPAHKWLLIIFEVMWRLPDQFTTSVQTCSKCMMILKHTCSKGLQLMSNIAWLSVIVHANTWTLVWAAEALWNHIKEHHCLWQLYVIYGTQVP